MKNYINGGATTTDAKRSVDLDDVDVTRTQSAVYHQNLRNAKAAEKDENAIRASMASNADLANKKQLTEQDKQEIYTRVNTWKEQGDNDHLLSVLNHAKRNGKVAELLDLGYTQDQLDEAEQYAKLNDRMGYGYAAGTRIGNTATGLGKTIASAAPMALESAKTAAVDDIANMQNSEYRTALGRLQDVASQMAELENSGNAYALDVNGQPIGMTREYKNLSDRKNILEAEMQELEQKNAVSKDSAGYQLYQSGQKDLARSDLGLDPQERMLKGAATSAAENIALAAVNPALVLPVLSAQGAADSMGKDIENGVAAGTALGKGIAKFGAGWAINSVGVAQMVDTMGVGGAKQNLASNIVRWMKDKSVLSGLANSNPTLYAVIAGATDNGLQSFAENIADRGIDAVAGTGEDISIEQLMNESLQAAGQGALGGAFTGLAGSGVNAMMSGNRAVNYANVNETETAQNAPVLDELSGNESVRQNAETAANARNSASVDELAEPLNTAVENAAQPTVEELTGDGGYGANTVGAAQSNYVYGENDVVNSQTRGLQQSLADSGMTAEEAADATKDITHEQISIAEQNMRAQQIIKEEGADNLAERITDAVNKGEALTDEDANAAYNLVAEYNRIAHDETVSAEDREKAALKAANMARVASANYTIAGRELGYLGHKVMDGANAVIKAQNGIDGMTRDAIENDPARKQYTEKATKQVQEAVDDARVKAAEEAAKAYEQEVKRLIAEARSRIAKAERKARGAERAADRAENRSRARIRKAGDRKANQYIQRGSPAEQLAKQVVSYSKDKSGTQGDAVKRMVSELFRLSKETVPAGTDTRQKYTAIDKLREVLFNQEAYYNTFNQAKNIVMDAYKDDPAALEKFQEWLDDNNGPNGNVSDAAIQAALTEAIIENEGGVKKLVEKLAFNNYEDVVDEVYNYIADQMGLVTEVADNLDPLMEEQTNREVAANKDKLNNLHEIIEDLLYQRVAPDDVEVTDKAANRVVDRTLADWQYSLKDIVKQRNGDVDGIRQSLIEQITNEYGINEESAKRIAETVSDIYKNRVDAAIDSNLKQRLPELFGGRKVSKTTRTALDSFREIVNMGTYNDVAVQNLIASKWGIPTLTADQTSRIMEIGDTMQGMNKSSKEYSDALDEIYSVMAENVESTKSEKLRTFLYNNMLDNPRTWVRNAVGNEAGGRMVSLAQAQSAVLQKLFIKDEADRTRARLSKADHDLMGKAFKYAETNAYDLYTKHGDFNAERGIANAKTVFGDGAIGKVLNARNDIVSNVLADPDFYGWHGFVAALAEDSNAPMHNWAKSVMAKADEAGTMGNLGYAGWQNQFARSLAGQIKAKGLDASVMDNPTSDIMKQMTEQAAKDADEATFHESSDLAKALNAISNTNALAEFFTTANLPFKQTPINVAKQALRYSPLNLIKTVAVDTAKVKSGEMTSAQFIDNLSKGLTGAELAFVGMVLASSGFLHVPGDDEDKNTHNKMQGISNYSMKFGDIYITLDWGAPATTAILVGAAVADSIKQRGVSFEALISAFGTSLGPVIDSTMLESLVNNIQNVAKYSNNGTDMAKNAVVSATKSFAGMFNSSFLYALGRTFDNTKRSYTTAKGETLDETAASIVNSYMNKTPGLSMLNNPKIDAWGRESKNAPGVLPVRAFENMLFPGNVTVQNTTEADKFLDDLYDSLPEDDRKGIYPTVYRGDIKLKGYDEADYEAFARAKGDAQYEMIDDLASQSYIDNLPSEVKNDIVNDIYSAAKMAGNRAISDDVDLGKSGQKTYDLYKELGPDGYIDYLAASKTLSRFENSNNPKAMAGEVDAILDDLGADAFNNLSEQNQKYAYIAKDKGADVLADYLDANKTYNAAKAAAGDKTPSYANMLVDLNFSQEEAGYIYAMHSGQNDKAKKAYEKYGSKAAYWVMKANASGKNGNTGGGEITEWAYKNISDPNERDTFIKVMTTSAKDW